MNTLLILFADKKSDYLFDKCFDSQSAFERAVLWAKNTITEFKGSIAVFAHKAIFSKVQEALSSLSVDAEIVTLENWTIQDLFTNMSQAAIKNNAANVLYAWADQPFINEELTKEIYSTHTEYKAEYTFADGYLSGMTPEMLDTEACGILSKLCETKDLAKNAVSRESVFDFLKLDINSFEVETVVGPEDFKLYRIALNTSDKAGLTLCKNIFEKKLQDNSPLDFAKKVCNAPECLKTIPSYYNIQISGKRNCTPIYEPDNTAIFGDFYMPFEKVKELIHKINEFSNKAVISLSLWGEATCHPDFEKIIEEILKYPGLSILVETDGYLITDALCQKIKQALDSCPEGTNQYERLMWIVRIDSATKETYQLINKSDGYEKAVNGVTILSKYFTGTVYPQLVRMNENEEELEAFYRFWSNPQNVTGGKVIVQKYSTFCGVLKDKKPADLSPIDRNPCWHLRRDMNILADGSVPLCREVLNSQIQGNVFTEDLQTIWKKTDQEVSKHINKTYSAQCEKCDEYYTFNF